MKTRKISHKAPGRRRSRTSNVALPALVTAAGGLGISSAAALELGELQVQSSLGQPLRATIAYALSPNEKINDSCVAVRAGGSDLPGLKNATIRVSKNLISITGAAPLMEPMLSANIVVDCRSSAHLSRNYLLFINPRATPVTMARQPNPAAATVTTPAVRAAAATRSAPAATPISVDTRYRVQPGDSLSGIVRRLETTGISSDAAIAALLETNPGAFINGDPDRLKAGSWLDIPPFTDAAATPAPAARTREEKADVAETSAGGAELYRGAETREPDTSRQLPATEFLSEVPELEVSEPLETTPDTTAAVMTETVADEPATSEVDYAAAYADLVAGDVVVDERATTATAPIEPAAAAANARVVKPSAGTRIVGSPEPAGSSWNGLIWAAVALISAFGAYLMFWPKLRERFVSRPIGEDERLPPRAEHVAPISVPESEMTVQEIMPSYDNVDFDLSGDSPTEENFALDADLVDGTGLGDAADVDVNRDFGFAATMDLDIELPDTASMQDSASETDIIPPPERPDDLVVSSEVLPTEETDEYDISVIVDATKVPDPAEVTERDLMAVPIDDTGQSRISDDYSIVDEDSQDILEQDYEDELSGSQLPHAEVRKAATELAETIGEDDPTGVVSLDDDEKLDDNAGRIVGSEDEAPIDMQLANLSEFDLSAMLEAQNDDVGDDLEVTANREADENIVAMPRGKDGAGAR